MSERKNVKSAAEKTADKELIGDPLLWQHRSSRGPAGAIVEWRGEAPVRPYKPRWWIGRGTYAKDDPEALQVWCYVISEVDPEARKVTWTGKKTAEISPLEVAGMLKVVESLTCESDP